MMLSFAIKDDDIWLLSVVLVVVVVREQPHAL